MEFPSIFRTGMAVLIPISYFSNFAQDVPVCGLLIGMNIDALRAAMPGAMIGEPEPSGFIRFHAKPASMDFGIEVAVKDGGARYIALKRADLDEIRAARQRFEAERKAERAREQERASRWKSIDDPNEMLMSWAESHPSGGGVRRKYVNFARWLIGTSDPNAWHIVGTHWNWDNDHAPLLWIVRQKNCDKATALEIFFLAQLSYYFRYLKDRSPVPSHEIEMFDFLMEIRDRFASGFYTRSQIAFDGEKTSDGIPRAGVSLEDEALAGSLYPREARGRSSGRDLSTGDNPELSTCYVMLETVA